MGNELEGNGYCSAMPRKYQKGINKREKCCWKRQTPDKIFYMQLLVFHFYNPYLYRDSQFLATLKHALSTLSLVAVEHRSRKSKVKRNRVNGLKRTEGKARHPHMCIIGCIRIINYFCILHPASFRALRAR